MLERKVEMNGPVIYVGEESRNEDTMTLSMNVINEHLGHLKPSYIDPTISVSKIKHLRKVEQ